MQNHYNVIYREEEREMMPTLKVHRTPPTFLKCSQRLPMQMFGVGCIPWSPLARGLVTRPLRGQSKRGDTDWFIGRYKQGGTEDIINRFAFYLLLFTPEIQANPLQRRGGGKQARHQHGPSRCRMGVVERRRHCTHRRNYKPRQPQGHSEYVSSSTISYSDEVLMTGP